MIEHRIVDFGRARLAVVEEIQPDGCILVVTHPLAADESPDWAEMDRYFIDPAPFPEAS